MRCQSFNRRVWFDLFHCRTDFGRYRGDGAKSHWEFGVFECKDFSSVKTTIDSGNRKSSVCTYIYLVLKLSTYLKIRYVKPQHLYRVKIQIKRIANIRIILSRNSKLIIDYKNVTIRTFFHNSYLFYKPRQNSCCTK